MSQLMLPMIPHGITVISDLVRVVGDDDRWVYFVGLYPICFHTPDDHKMIMVTSQLIESGACRHSDIIKTFSVSKRKDP
jgi:hypothetical protein